MTDARGAAMPDAAVDRSPPPTTTPAVRGSRIAIAGFVFSALFLVAWLLLRSSPSFETATEDLGAYYGDPQQRQRSVAAALYVVPLASIAFIWFMAALRDRYMRSAAREHTILSTAQVVAGALVVVSLFTMATVELAVVWLVEAGEEDGARSLLALGEASSEIMALRSAAVFIGVSASRGTRSGLFPRAFGLVSMLAAVLLLVVYEQASWVSMVFPAWVAVASALILVRRRAIETAGGA